MRGRQPQIGITVFEIITIPQIDGARRLLAVSPSDARAVRRDPAQIECITVLGNLDVHRDGTLDCRVGPLWRDLPTEIRDALHDAATDPTTGLSETGLRTARHLAGTDEHGRVALADLGRLEEYRQYLELPIEHVPLG